MTYHMIDGKHHYLGSFNTDIEAHNAYLNKLKEHGKEN